MDYQPVFKRVAKPMATLAVSAMLGVRTCYSSAATNQPLTHACRRSRAQPWLLLSSTPRRRSR